ncbi:C2 domain [Sesbania bispinosa]|nr:C2 domain [Sesbania bispinosa]
MTITALFQHPPQTMRRLVVDVVDARNLLPKDGQGSSSPYVIADFDGQRKRTTTRFKELVFSWIRGKIGLTIYYYDELLQEDDKQQEQPPRPPQEEQAPGTELC